MEEQGRKTLHSHFLLWVKNWEKVLDGLERNSTGRDEFFRMISEYAGKGI